MLLFVAVQFVPYRVTNTWLGLHSDAKLTQAQRQQLADGLRATLSGWDCGHGGGG